MESSTERVKHLIDLYLEGKASKAEQNELEALYAAGIAASPYIDDLEAEELVGLKKEGLLKALQEIALSNARKTQRLWPRIRIAAGIAAAVATIVFGVWFFTSDKEILKQVQDDVALNDIAPGKNGATITLSTGEVIQLSEAKKGVIIDPTSLTYDDGSEIASETAQPRNDGRGGSLKTGTIVQMAASTAKGQIYEFTLPDGSHVFLNSDSKIIFPSQFSGKERKILLEGEAYFVVKHNEKQPFRVESRGQVVEDIGTEFNINAYADESNVKTTLVEGSASVAVLAASEKAGPSPERITLGPNEQTSLANGRLKVNTVDPESAISWKSGYFVFQKTSLEEVMRRISRWYDVEIIYESNSLKEIPLSGSASQYDNVSRLLGTIENTGAARFKIDKGKIIVIK